MYETINQINFTLILDRVRVGYKKCWYNRISLIEDWKLTDGRILNISGNYVNDFSKERPRGNPFSFIKQYLNLTDRATFQRFEENFDIKLQWFVKNNKQKQFKQKERIIYCPDW